MRNKNLEKLTVADLLDIWPGDIKGELKSRAKKMKVSEFVRKSLNDEFSGSDAIRRAYYPCEEEEEENELSDFRRKVIEIIGSNWYKNGCKGAKRDIEDLKEFMEMIKEEELDKDDLSDGQYRFFCAIRGYYNQNR